MKINQNDRKRKFFGQISFEYEHNANSELTEKDFRESVIQRIKDYCKNEEDRYHIIFHDKDLKDDGSSKPLHAHFILILSMLILTHQYLKLYQFQGNKI